MLYMTSVVFIVLFGGVGASTCMEQCHEMYSDNEDALNCAVEYCFFCTVSEKNSAGRQCEQTFENAESPESLIVLEESCNYEKCEVACRRHMLTLNSGGDQYVMKYRTCCEFNATSEQCVYYDIRSSEKKIEPWEDNMEHYAWTTKRCAFYTDIAIAEDETLEMLDAEQPEDTEEEVTYVSVEDDTTCVKECHATYPNDTEALDCIVDGCYHCTVSEKNNQGRQCQQTFENAESPEPLVLLDQCCGYEECEVVCRKHMLTLNSGGDQYVMKYRTCCEYNATSNQCLYYDIRSSEKKIEPWEDNMDHWAWTTKRCAFYTDVAVAEDETKNSLDDEQPEETTV